METLTKEIIDLSKEALAIKKTKEEQQKYLKELEMSIKLIDSKITSLNHTIKTNNSNKRKYYQLSNNWSQMIVGNVVESGILIAILGSLLALFNTFDLLNNGVIIGSSLITAILMLGGTTNSILEKKKEQDYYLKMICGEKIKGTKKEKKEKVKTAVYEKNNCLKKEIEAKEVERVKKEKELKEIVELVKGSEEKYKQLQHRIITKVDERTTLRNDLLEKNESSIEYKPKTFLKK